MGHGCDLPQLFRKHHVDIRHPVVEGHRGLLPQSNLQLPVVLGKAADAPAVACGGYGSAILLQDHI